MWYAGRPSDPAQIILLTLAINYVSEVREERTLYCVVIFFENSEGPDTFGGRESNPALSEIEEGFLQHKTRHPRSNITSGYVRYRVFLCDTHTLRHGPLAFGNHKGWKSTASTYPSSSQGSGGKTREACAIFNHNHNHVPPMKPAFLCLPRGVGKLTQTTFSK